MGKNTHPTQKTGRKPKPVSENDSASTSVLATVTNKLNELLTTVRTANRNVVLAASLAVVLVLVGIISIVFSGSEPEQQTQTQTPQTVTTAEPIQTNTSVILIEGTLQTINADGEWEDAADGLQLSETASLRTVGATSRAVIAFENGSELRLDANSEIEIESISDDRIVVAQRGGYTFSRILSSDKQFIIKTTDAQFEAIGTAFRTSATGDEQAVEVFHSSVIETQSNKRATEGKKLIAKSNVNPSLDETVSDLDIEELKTDKFIQWNIERDKANDSFKNELGFLSDTDSPDLEITSHRTGDVVLLDANATKGTIELGGRTDSNTTVTIKTTSADGDNEVEFKSGDDGKFLSPVIETAIGDVTFELSVRDRAGNTTEQTIRITFQRKSAPVTNETDGVSLSITIDEDIDELQAFWALTGDLEAPDGYKFVYDEQANPTYPDDSSLLIAGNSTTFKTTEFAADTTYYFRACIYDAEADTCSNYSDQVSVTPNDTTE